jgi:OOP family OmpA-OmpF porin
VPVAQNTLLPIVHSETVYFDFDHSKMRSDQNATLDKVVDEIDTYKPADVTVTGYTDRSGTISYNDELSRRRAHSVSDALKNRGIVNEQIDQKSRGETENAVATADGVKMAENRRVVIDFRR